MTERIFLSALRSYQHLAALAQTAATTSLKKLFAEDSDRADRLHLTAAGLALDYSKQLITPEILTGLLTLAQEAGLAAEIADLFAGVHINNTEDRPALHMLLRAASSTGSKPRLEQVESSRELMRTWSEQVRSGAWVGFSDAPITDVVNIGIGGSDLGPRLVTEALQPFQGAVACHYVANVDPADLQGCLLDLNPASTLFIICSKSFRTEETLTNGLAARQWLINAGASDNNLARHFVAVTSNVEAAREFGILEQHCLPMWDWVGGRYSVWSGIGLSCAIAIGWDNFARFLAGAEAMDQHVQSAALSENMPVLCSLLDIWNYHFLAAGNHVVLPYDNGLRQLPAYLQQLTMESNGKRVNTNGTPLPYNTGPVLWGSAGTMGQHSFHQLLHQGTLLCPADFVLPLTTHTGMQAQHRRLVANCLAQSRTLMIGRSIEEAEAALRERGLSHEEATSLAPHLAMPGNRPSNTITMLSLTPNTLGALLALYEHRTFCTARLWGINPFDQWGVELGKEIGVQVLEKLENAEASTIMDASTEQLISHWRQAQS
ncbi:MAG: glucose-6-phosphate isomerase [Pseudomonadota bacterium]